MEPHPLRFLRSLGRSREIATVLLQHGFGDLLERLHLRRYLQWGRRLVFWRRYAPEPHKTTRAVRIRLALESLGATFIKFGQVMSTRPDLLPADVITELAKLQEHCPPFSSDPAVVVAGELGAPVDVLFAEFDPTPVAAASLAQVHQARLHDGTRLAVKIRRPGIVREVERDLALLSDLALLVKRHIPEAETFDPVGLVNQLARTIRRELNFQREARTMTEFARLFRQDGGLFVPRVYEELTTDGVLTMQYVEGHRIDGREALLRAGLSPRQIASTGARIFMKQAFELGLFHGDPHPGNIRILDDGSISLLDYGMVGMLDEEMRENLVDLFLSINRQDVRAAVDVIQVLGRPLQPVDTPLLRADVRDFIENYYGVPLEKLRVGPMLNDFVAILAHHRIRCPSDLMLLIRALVTLEGVGRTLDPEFNMAEHLTPFIEHVVSERSNPRRIAVRLLAETRSYLRLAHDVPFHLARSLEKLSRDELKIPLEHRGLDHLITELDRSGNRLAVGMVMSALIVASALIIRTGPDAFWISVPIFVLSSLLGVWLIYGIFRSGRL